MASTVPKELYLSVVIKPSVMNKVERLQYNIELCLPFPSKDKSKDRDIENITPANVTESGHIERLLDQNCGKSRRKRKPNGRFPSLLVPSAKPTISK